MQVKNVYIYGLKILAEIILYWEKHLHVGHDFKHMWWLLKEPFCFSSEKNCFFIEYFDFSSITFCCGYF